MFDVSRRTTSLPAFRTRDSGRRRRDGQLDSETVTMVLGIVRALIVLSIVGLDVYNLFLASFQNAVSKLLNAIRNN